MFSRVIPMRTMAWLVLRSTITTLWKTSLTDASTKCDHLHLHLHLTSEALLGITHSLLPPPCHHTSPLPAATAAVHSMTPLHHIIIYVNITLIKRLNFSVKCTNNTLLMIYMRFNVPVL